jgi:hypothetical protein
MPTIKVLCESCDGTGLYCGFAEGKGVAVVCNGCDGTGQTEISYKEYAGRKGRRGVKWVYQTNPGIGLGGDDPSKYGGMSIKDWKAGKPFVPGMENRACVCPAWWYQGADYKKKPEWDDKDQRCIDMGSFSDCKHFKKKEKCWERWDRENKR